jgi:hypothetical protein
MTITYTDAVAHSKGLHAADIAAAQSEEDGVTAALHRARPVHAGAAEAHAYAEAVENPAIAALNRRRDSAIRRADQRHQDRLAAAGQACGVSNSSPGNSSAAHAVDWLNQLKGA